MPIQNIGGFFFTGGIVESFDFTNGFAFGSQQLFWDGRENNLSTMVLRPVLNHIEMGIGDLDQLTEKVRTIPYYKDLFYKAYGSEEITTEKISQGLSAFILSITSQNTKFDKARRSEAQLSPLELEGQQLFSETYDCNGCHQVEDPHGYVFAGTFANIGLDKDYEDNGVQNVTGNQWDAGRFKIPSLRNVLYTAPYMHDGRFETLDEVLEHYSIGIEDNENLDFRLRSTTTGGPLAMNISPQDKRAIIAFLGTLTDRDMLTNPKFSNPFKTK